MDKSALDRLIRDYTAAWSEPDPDKRGELLAAVWEEDGEYTDPLIHAPNRADLDAAIGRFLAEYPGAFFTIRGEIDLHHHHIRFFWDLHAADGTVLPGMDCGEISSEGKLKKIVGFF